MDDYRVKGDGAGRPRGWDKGEREIPGERTRRGRVGLTTSMRRALFIGGLAAVALVVLLLGAYD